MTIVVWDGETLATDKAANDGAAQWETTKAWYTQDAFDQQVIVSGVGVLCNILLMRDWYTNGQQATLFPREQMGDLWCQFLLVNHEGLWRYEQSRIPIEHGKLPCAFGVGKDFAFGALAMGADAVTAVGVANDHSIHCGLGVNTYVLKGD